MPATRTFRIALVTVLAVLALGLGPGRLPSLEAARAGMRTESAQCPRLSTVFDVEVGSQQNLKPAVAYNHIHDEYLVVWQTEQDAYTTDIWAARMNSGGEIPSFFNVVTGAAQKRTQPAVAYSATRDQYLIVYAREVGTDDLDLYATLVDWNGGWFSQELLVRTAADKQVNPAVVYNDEDDEYLVVYENQWAGGVHDVDAQRIRAIDGVRESWANVATGTNQERRGPDVDYNLDGNQYLIAYSYVGHAPSHPPQIRGKVAVASLEGISVQPEIQLCCEPSGAPQQAGVAVAAGPGEYLITFWNGIMTAPIYGRRVAYTGEPLGPNTGFALTQAAPYTWYDSDVDFDGYGYLSTWFAASGSPHQDDVYGCQAQVGQDQARGGQFTIVDGPQHQREEALACDAHGDCLVVYQDGPTDGSDYDIRARFVRRCLMRLYLPLVLR